MEDITEHRDEFVILLREGPLVHLPDQGDGAMLVLDNVTPLEPRDGEGNGDGSGCRDVLEQRLDLGREPWGDWHRWGGREVESHDHHQEPEGGDDRRNGTLDSIPSVASLHRVQEMSQRREVGSTLVGGTELGLHPSPLFVFTGRRLRQSPHQTTRYKSLGCVRIHAKEYFGSNARNCNHQRRSAITFK